MKENNWDRLVDGSGGDLQQPDVLVISDLSRYHVHKMREDRSFTYQDFNEWDFIQFQTNDTGTPGAGPSSTAPAPAPVSGIRTASNSKRDLKPLDECIFPNEREPITKKKMDDWIDAFSIVAAAHSVEKHIGPASKRPPEPPTTEIVAHAKWIDDQEWLFTMLRKATKGKSVGKTIRRLEDHEGSKAYDEIIDFYNKH